MIIGWYFICFIFYSFLGWIWETIYCTYNKKHFENRGFLFGPICPIYGVSILALQVLDDYLPFISNINGSWWKIFLFSMIGSAIIEFSTSFYMEKRFNARWWDYSALPFNIQGRICLPVSMGFGIAGIIVMWYLLPAIDKLHMIISFVLIEILVIIFAGIFGADFAATEASLSTLIQRLNEMEEEFTQRGEEVYQRMCEISINMSRRQKYILKSVRSFGIKRKNIEHELGRELREMVQNIEKGKF